MAYQFGADGKIAGGELAGLTIDLQKIRDETKATYDATYQSMEPWERMYAPAYEEPYAKGGKVEGLKFGNDGNLYGVVGSKDISSVDNQGNAVTSSELITAPIKGWQFDTSTLKQSPYYKPPTPNKWNPNPATTLYDATIEKDASSYLIKVTDGATGYTAGWARQMIQQEVAADSVKRKPGSGDSRLAYGGVDPRLYTPTPATTVKR